MIQKNNKNQKQGTNQETLNINIMRDALNKAAILFFASLFLEEELENQSYSGKKKSRNSDGDNDDNMLDRCRILVIQSKNNNAK